MNEKEKTMTKMFHEGTAKTFFMFEKMIFNYLISRNTCYFFYNTDNHSRDSTLNFFFLIKFVCEKNKRIKIFQFFTPKN